MGVLKPRVSEREQRRAELAQLSVRYDREKLYQEVWSQPVQQVARAYGFSDVFLARICRKLDVPVPPRGYWAPVRAGQKVKKPRLLMCVMSAQVGVYRPRHPENSPFYRCLDDY